MDRSDQEYFEELYEIVDNGFKKPSTQVNYESSHHYKKYGVYKITYDPATDISRTCQFVFNAPKREAEMIHRSQKSLSEMINDELVFTRKFEVREESVQI